MSTLFRWISAFVVLGATLFGVATFDSNPRVEAGPRVAEARDGEKEVDEGELKKLIKANFLSQDAEGRRELLLRCARINDRAPARVILQFARRISSKDAANEWYWALLDGVGSFNRPEAFSEMGDFILRNRKHPVARDLMHTLQKNRSKYVNRVIRRVLEKGPQDLKLMAIDMAAQIPVRRTVDILMPLYGGLDGKTGADEKSLRRRLVYALEALTLQRLGDNYPNWSNWWSVHRQKGLRRIRKETKNTKHATSVIRLDPVREREFLGLESMPAGTVLVVEGPTARNGVNTNNDDISAVLTRLKVKHDTVLKERLEEDNYSIDSYAAIFINCTQIHEFCQSPGHTGGNAVGNRLRRCLGPNPHDNVQFKIKAPGMEKLKRWVGRGGYLFTEDWVLKECLSDMYPDHVALGAKLDETMVDIRPAKGRTTHTLLRGVFVPPPKIEDFDWGEEEDDDDDWDGFDDPFDEDDDKKGKKPVMEGYDPTVEDDDGDTEEAGRGRTKVRPRNPEEEPEVFDDPKIDRILHEWKIDNESNAISVKSSKVEVLVTSSKLRQLQVSPAVAITFPYKSGRVLHVLSHFGKQNSKHNEATIENLLVNFLLEVRVRVR